jgi:hypothetical protein
MNVGMKRDTLEIVSAESLECELDALAAGSLPGMFGPRSLTWQVNREAEIFLRTGCEPAAARRRSGKLYYGRRGSITSRNGN